MREVESSQSNVDLRHDAKACLLVLTVGLEVLKKTRNDLDQFNELLESIRKDGLEPLRTLVLNLLDRLDEQKTQKAP